MFISCFRFWFVLTLLKVVYLRQNVKSSRQLEESKVYNVKVQFDPSVILKQLDNAPVNENFDIQDFLKKIKSTEKSSTSTPVEVVTSVPTVTIRTTLSTASSPKLMTSSLAPSTIDEKESESTTDYLKDTMEEMDESVIESVSQDVGLGPASSTLMIPGQFVNYIKPIAVYPQLPLLYYFGHQQDQHLQFGSGASKYHHVPNPSLQYFWPVVVTDQNYLYNIVN